MKKFVIQNVGLGSTLKFGCGLGALSNFIPGLILALIGKAIVSSLRALLESWQNAELANILGQSIRANMLTILKLEGALKTLQDLDNAAPVFILATILAWMALGGAVIAALSGLLTAAYNFTARLFGGIEIELREDRR
ncbi:MAG: DUF3566 domain-containing protein [Anaerolineales bacterium]|nr:DUF3566 domain-containing protein [Anaerolineales bacterium]